MTLDRLIAGVRYARGWAVTYARSLIAVASFAAVCLGFWIVHPSLGLIVGGGLPLTGLVWSHCRGGVEPARRREE